jgi:alpha/beta superfamily hydrolase
MGELIKVTLDGVELDGYVSIPTDAKALVLHVPGLAGNFYENSFIRFFEEAFAARGIGLATLNTRGHDYLADVIIHGEVESGGAAHTQFDGYLSDVGSWASWLKAEYGLRQVLQGHSSGAVVVAQSSIDNAVSDALVATVLISPADMMREVSSGLAGHRMEELVQHANDRVASGFGSDLMPEDALSGYLIDADCFFEFVMPNGPWTIVDWKRPANTKALFEAGPCLIVFGGDEDSEELDTSTVLGGYASLDVPHVPQTVRVAGAGHSYRGHESELADTIADFVMSAL